MPRSRANTQKGSSSSFSARDVLDFLSQFASQSEGKLGAPQQQQQQPQQQIEQPEINKESPINKIRETVIKDLSKTVSAQAQDALAQGENVSSVLEALNNLLPEDRQAVAGPQGGVVVGQQQGQTPEAVPANPEEQAQSIMNQINQLSQQQDPVQPGGNQVAPQTQESRVGKTRHEGFSNPLEFLFQQSKAFIDPETGEVVQRQGGLFNRAQNVPTTKDLANLQNIAQGGKAGAAQRKQDFELAKIEANKSDKKKALEALARGRKSSRL